jgi:hypothetical protein
MTVMPISRKWRRDLSEKVPFQGKYFYFKEASFDWLAFDRTLFRYVELCLFLGIPFQRFYKEKDRYDLQKSLQEIVNPIIEAAGDRDFGKILQECNDIFEADAFAFIEARSRQEDILWKQHNLTTKQ